MIKELSILLPVYNNDCRALVGKLLGASIRYEIIVADDCSSDAEIVERNKEIGNLPNCKYIVLKKNLGRAKIRNYLARQAAYEWLLFLDCDVDVPECFVGNYLKQDESDMVYGGIRFCGNEHQKKQNLRCKYEYSAMPRTSLEARVANPYHSISAANFMIRRDVMLAHPFDERFTHYGYEDVMFGKVLAENHVSIQHIDNPVVIGSFDSNVRYVEKIEESLRTLKQFEDELEGYSTLLTIANKLKRYHLSCFMKRWHKLFGNLEKRNLMGNNPDLAVFKLYKLGYFLAQ